MLIFKGKAGCGHPFRGFLKGFLVIQLTTEKDKRANAFRFMLKRYRPPVLDNKEV